MGNAGVGRDSKTELALIPIFERRLIGYLKAAEKNVVAAMAALGVIYLDNEKDLPMANRPCIG